MRLCCVGLKRKVSLKCILADQACNDTSNIFSLSKVVRADRSAKRDLHVTNERYVPASPVELAATGGCTKTYSTHVAAKTYNFILASYICWGAFLRDRRIEFLACYALFVSIQLWPRFWHIKLLLSIESILIICADCENFLLFGRCGLSHFSVCLLVCFRSAFCNRLLCALCFGLIAVVKAELGKAKERGRGISSVQFSRLID